MAPAGRLAKLGVSACVCATPSGSTTAIPALAGRLALSASTGMSSVSPTTTA
ncbi:MAG: hypothetical protein AW07_04177 [Candidatus Accumulibacter sp. SK-11]|nr:MAG: hypothetical protein AW07_04177 [Candidatus Accumulibacter sp. SK-11]